MHHISDRSETLFSLMTVDVRFIVGHLTHFTRKNRDCEDVLGTKIVFFNKVKILHRLHLICDYKIVHSYRLICVDVDIESIE